MLTFLQCDYINVPTTVFTPLEYSCCGYSEEAAVAKFGKDNVEVFHTNLWPLEWTVAEKENNVCYAKLICNKEGQVTVEVLVAKKTGDETSSHMMLKKRFDWLKRHSRVCKMAAILLKLEAKDLVKRYVLYVKKHLFNDLLIIFFDFR